MDLKDKSAIVTGGTKGIGRAISEALLREGVSVCVAARHHAEIDKTIKELNQGDEDRAIGFVCDVRDYDQVKKLIDYTVKELGGLDILINNSGIICDRTIKKLTLGEFENVVRVNLTGTFLVTQKAAAVLRNGGRIINLSSVSGQMGLFGQANYSSSKAAIIALTKVSAREFARRQITANAIAPGFIDVGMSKGMPEEVTKNFIKQIPLGRLGDASEIVNVALFLASPMSSYITGHALNVNGGYYMG